MVAYVSGRWLVRLRFKEISQYDRHAMVGEKAAPIAVP